MTAQKLGQDAHGLGPQRLANADFPGSFGHRDQHDVHDTDAGHDQCDDTDDKRRELHAHAHLIELCNEACAVEELEIVLLARLQAPVMPQHSARFFDGVVDELGRLRVHRDVDGPRKSIPPHQPVGTHECRDRNQDVVVEASPESGFLLVKNPDHFVFATVDPDFFSNRIGEGIELFPDRVADDRHLPRGLHIDLREIPSQPDIVGVVGCILRRSAADRDVRIRGLSLVLRDEPKVPDFRPDDIRGLDVPPDGLSVLQRERRPEHGLPPLGVRMESARRPFLNLERLRAQDAHFALQGALHHGDPCHHGDDRCDSRHNAHKGQDRSQLVADDRSQRHEHRVKRSHGDSLHRRAYS